ncbi:DUF5362 family protein (plasmid) [Aneurinibacillus sp. Ricciae_BoGa-3]|uniref:DUF5362 family protein n=1 Tax=Aneurinibacillus sp. Ricciae_BoGa-3 TaxID=3022697 RepID=UPI00234021C7|nr:DUF5362 family protein [Aneurinibacillus sp. Ricciae_BoGa-3]WCK57233.1 DUF5362 family protein [Aneurinibacillus sp. Ricciae_BoGa-3]
MKKQLKSLAKWSKFVGVIELIIGALLALCGYTVFYIGAIPGLLLVILSIRLLRASRSAKRLNYNLRLIQTEDDIYDETLGLMASYFRLQAFYLLFLILSLVVLVLIEFVYHVSMLSLMYNHLIKFHIF